MLCGESKQIWLDTARAIASLQIGEQVSVYNSATGKSGTQTVQATFITHDTDLLDVALRVDGEPASKTVAQATTKAAHAAPTTSQLSGTSSTSREEVVHTTDVHPWYTADHGWLPANFLRVCKQVVRLDGSTATVVAVPGAASMWDLTVSNVHTFAVGVGAYVVHNCGTDKRADPNSLDKHSREHGGDIDAQTPDEYVQKSQEFRKNSLEPNASGNIERKIDPVDGSYRAYDPGTNTFGAYTADNRTINFFKPSPRDFGDLFRTPQEWLEGAQGLPF